MILVAAAIAIFVGLAHSYLGEKYILIRLFRQPLPKLRGDDSFTRQTLRFAWHLTSIAWWGFAAILILLYLGRVSESAILAVVATIFGISSLVSLVSTRGRHLSWLLFGAISLICYVAM